jgi:acid phosphatase (class A)
MMDAAQTGTPRLPLILLVVMMLAPAGKAQTAAQAHSTVPELRAGALAGYLAAGSLPDSVVLLPEPPAKGSSAFALDQAVSRQSLALRGTARWDLAKKDADLTFPQATEIFSCSVGAPITEADTPHLYLLMRRSVADAAMSTYGAKDRYKRARPFLANKQPTCTPDQEASLRGSGSYPSGHSAIGWTWALILAEISPEHADAILTRGRAFGQSRVICNAHWQSDVIEGRFMGDSTVAKLHSDAGFRADLETAKADLAAARDKGLKPSRDCAAEAAALAIQPAKAKGR